MGNKLTTEQLEKLLKEQKIDLADLKTTLGLSHQRYNNWIARGIPASQHKRIADAIDISVDELLGDEEQAAPKYKGDRQYLHQIIDSLPRRSLLKAKSALQLFVVEDPAASQAQKVRKKRT